MRVVVSGADGFIGSHLVPALANNRWDVVGLVEPQIGKNIEGPRLLAVDIASGMGLDSALHGGNIVIHLAARNHVLHETAHDPLAEYRKVNVEGTRNMIKAAIDAGARMFVHFSSVKAMGEESNKVFDERDPCLPTTAYGISKLESEEVVHAESGAGGMKAIILRLPMVYGPQNKGNLPRMIQWADRGLPFPLFQPDNLRSMVYVENVVAAILRVLKSAPEGVNTYIVKDRKDYSTQEMFAAICRELGKTPRFFRVPTTLSRLGGLISEDFRKVSGSLRVTSEKIEKELGFSPPVPFEEGIARTVQWYKRSVQLRSA